MRVLLLYQADYFRKGSSLVFKEGEIEVWIRGVIVDESIDDVDIDAHMVKDEEFLQVMELKPE